MQTLRIELELAAIEAGDLGYVRAIRTMRFDRKGFLARLAFYTC